MNERELRVSKIRNGTVIDHITGGQALNGLPVPERQKLHLFYFRQGNNVDGLEYFGVRRALSFNDETVDLRRPLAGAAIATIRQPASRCHGQPFQPDATLPVR